MAIASASNTVCTDDAWATHADTYLHCTVYFIFILCILSPGRLIKKVWRDVMDRDICILLFVILFLIIYGVCFIMRRALAFGARFRSLRNVHRPTALAGSGPF